MSCKRERGNESLDHNENKRARTNSSTKIQFINETRFINTLDSDVKFTNVTEKEIRHLEKNIFPTIDSEHMQIIEVRGLRHTFLIHRYSNNNKFMQHENCCMEKLMTGDEVCKTPSTQIEVVEAFHGTDKSSVKQIINRGFDIRLASLNSRFGAGIYFSSSARKADKFVFMGNICLEHQIHECRQCVKSLLLCKVSLGTPRITYQRETNQQMEKRGHAIPGYNSVRTGCDNERYHDRNETYCVYKDEQAVPRFEFIYKLRDYY